MAVPIYEPDIFSRAAIEDPYPHYRAIRDLGPVVLLGAQNVLAVGRYDDVRTVLADAGTFRSGEGVGFNEFANELIRGTTLASDQPVHDHLRTVVAHRLTPRALRGERERIQQLAEQVVVKATEREVIDGVADLAQAMPMSVVPEFLGFPEDCRDRLLEWAGGAIEALGPPSERTPAAGQLAGELGRYAEQLVLTRGLAPGSLGDDLLTSADTGKITVEQCPALLLDYFGPSLETTISALGSALALFSQHPDQWALLREDPSLVGGAFNEVVRLESPLRTFTRVTSGPTVLDGTPVPGGARVAVLYASANRDERRWDDPEKFDILRDNADHLGLGYGVHACAGQGLARLEFAAVITALAARVARIEPAGEPVRVVNSLLRAYRSLPLRLVAG